MFSRKYFYQGLLIALLLSYLTACGFQLRGVDSRLLIPPKWQKLALNNNNPRDELTRQVKLTFQNAGVKWSSRISANYILILTSSELTQRIQSLNSQARPSEIELTLKSYISVYDGEDKEVLPATEMIVYRQIDNDPLNATGANEEIRLTSVEMYHQLATNILHKISIVANSENKN